MDKGDGWRQKKWERKKMPFIERFQLNNDAF